MAARAASEGLREYERKRDFTRTPEPRARPSAPPRRARRTKLRFVVQKHRASRLHYDFRLEADGVLKSWALPKGPSLNPKERRLAMQVEDHPLAYRDFEGVIPEGSYGAGEVIVWDRGTYDVVGDEPSEQAIEKGKIKVVLHGKRLHGTFTLVRMRGRASSDRDRAWLMIKDRDPGADPSFRAEEHDTSVKSGKTLAQVAANPRARRWISRRTTNGAARAPPMAGFMLATLVAAPFSDEDWLFEIKWDGIRALCTVEANGEVRLVSRRGLDQLAKFPELADLSRAFRPLPIVVDGEIVSLDEEGKSSFQRLQSSANRAGLPVRFVAFDVLYYDGKDVRSEPLERRKELLRRAIEPNNRTVLYSQHVPKEGKKLFAVAREKGLEGILAKRGDAPYVAGRSREWLKIKAHMSQECVIGGYTEPRGARQGIGALLLGVYEKDQLEYAGHVGTGFSTAMLASLHAKLSRIETDESPFRKPPRTRTRVHWTAPKYVAEVRFSEWTSSGKLRQPAFLGLRDDKSPRECVREVP